jgi:hypothetical protein
MGKYRVTDPFFGAPYVDVDEWRDKPEPHRYVHGGFEGTDTLFSFYFPPVERYQGRFLQFLPGGLGGGEHQLIGGDTELGGFRPGSVIGAYLVESNQGHRSTSLCAKAGSDRSVYSHRASAESARYSRHVAAEMYSEAPHHGYIYGGSGGGKRAIHCLEHVDDVWSGGVPFIMGGPVFHPHMTFSPFLNARRMLGSDAASVIDATEPGGTGDPFAGLSVPQREALQELYRMGFPRGSEPSLEWMEAMFMYWGWHADQIREFDPTYFDRFYTEAGYVGFDRREDLEPHVVNCKVTVREVVAGRDLVVSDARVAWGMSLGNIDLVTGVILDSDVRSPSPVGATVRVLTGEAAGRELYCTRLGESGVLLAIAGGEAGTLQFAGVVPGDELHIDNSRYLAYCYYHRHHVPEIAVFNGLRVDGHPVYPQHEIEPWNPLLGMSAFTGGFGDRKMILMQCTNDVAALPAQGVMYHEDARAVLGDRIDDQFRILWTEHGVHGTSSSYAATGMLSAPSFLVDYIGTVEQAICDVVDWVEQGTAPPLSTRYTFDAENRLNLPATAAERGGIQPVVTLTADGGARTDVKTGQPVAFEATFAVPPGAGSVVSVEWDFEGSGAFGTASTPALGADNATADHAYAKPGTYFASVRINAHRTGDAVSEACRVENLARARVVVT